MDQNDAVRLLAVINTTKAVSRVRGELAAGRTAHVADVMRQWLAEDTQPDGPQNNAPRPGSRGGS